MADELTPAEKAQKEVDKINKENDELRERIEQAKVELQSQVQVDSINLTKEIVQDENAKLKAQLEAMRAQVKTQKESSSPVENAAVAAEEAAALQTVPAPTDNTKAKE